MTVPPEFQPRRYRIVQLYTPLLYRLVRVKTYWHTDHQSTEKSRIYSNLRRLLRCKTEEALQKVLWFTDTFEYGQCLQRTVSHSRSCKNNPNSQHASWNVEWTCLLAILKSFKLLAAALWSWQYKNSQFNFSRTFPLYIIFLAWLKGDRKPPGCVH